MRVLKLTPFPPIDAGFACPITFVCFFFLFSFCPAEGHGPPSAFCFFQVRPIALFYIWSPVFSPCPSAPVFLHGDFLSAFCPSPPWWKGLDSFFLSLTRFLHTNRKTFYPPQINLFPPPTLACPLSPPSVTDWNLRFSAPPPQTRFHLSQPLT